MLCTDIDMLAAATASFSLHSRRLRHVCHTRRRLHVQHSMDGPQRHQLNAATTLIVTICDCSTRPWRWETASHWLCDADDWGGLCM